MRILGIDPGSRITGFGIIEGEKNKWKVIDSGCLVLKGSTYLERLGHLQQLLLHLLTVYRPNEAALEEVFLHKNANSALKLGQARGLVLANLLSFHVPIFEYAPRQIKQAIVGKGNASKAQVQAMLKVLFNSTSLTFSGFDASDALAIALTHAHVKNSFQNVPMRGKSFARRGKSKRSVQWLNYDWKNTRKIV